MELNGIQIATFFVWLVGSVTFILALKFLTSELRSQHRIDGFDHPIDNGVVVYCR